MVQIKKADFRFTVALKNIQTKLKHWQDIEILSTIGISHGVLRVCLTIWADVLLFAFT